MNNLLDQLYKTKLRFAGFVSATLGLALLVVSHLVEDKHTLSWLIGWPTNELGTALLSAGIIAIVFEFYTRKENDARLDERLRAAIRHEAPAIREAVLDSFAFNASALKAVASDETLDRIATNAIGLRLDDQALAEDAYRELRDQVIRAPERWHDVDISVVLHPWSGGPSTGKGSMFEATIRWQYRVTPSTPALRFACVSDPAEYRELQADPTVTDQWYFDSSAPVDPSSPEAFELLQVTVNGHERPVRRTSRKGSQVYSAVLGKDVEAGAEVQVAYTYRMLLQRHGHLLYLDLPRPTKGVHTSIDYSHAGIRRLNILDYLAGPDAARIEQSPVGSPTRTVDISYGGQVFPRAGVAVVWVLEDEFIAGEPTAARSKNAA